VNVIVMVGARVQDARKRRGLTQRELAAAAGVSVSLVRKLEQGDYDGGLRLETLHRIAVALGVTTTALMSESDAGEAESGNVIAWEPVRRALASDHDGAPDDEPTIGGVRDAFHDAVDAVLASQYSDLMALLPSLISDAGDLVSLSAGNAVARARQIRSDVRHLAAYMLGQTWQFDAAIAAIDLAISDADDDLTALAALDCKCWLLLRQGRLAESRELATRWADTTEPHSIPRRPRTS
jgi:transcriptional regulator with XRE-family HTH domain